MKFEVGDKVVCTVDKYCHISERQCVTVKEYINENEFLIEEEMGTFEDVDFRNVRIK